MNTLVHWGGPILQQAVPLGGIACLILLPLIAYLHWRSRGKVLGRWVWIAPLLIIYSVGVIAFTFLPLPDPDTFQCGSSLYYPRYFAGWSLEFAWKNTAGLGILRFFTWWFVQIYLNILLFVPAGIAARWLTKASFRTTLLGAFFTSLLIELTQLTGIWGYFECRYRTFDVDDMITNTLGAVIGWSLVVLLERSRSRVSENNI